MNIAVSMGAVSLLEFQAFMVMPADAAVSCFFVVSGFIMAMIASKKGNAVDFLGRRAIRIFPTYWIALLVSSFIPIIIAGVSPLSSWKELLLLKPAGLLPLTWALVFEIYFYICVFFIMILFKNRSDYGFAIFCVVHVSLILLSPGSFVADWVFLSSAAATLWIGSAVFMCLQARRSLIPIVIIALAIIVLLTNLDFSIRGHQMVLFSTIFAPLFLALIKLEQKNRLSVPKALLWWSERSYSLFLWHLPVMTLTALLISQTIGFDTIQGSSIYIFATVFLVIAVALVAYRVIELPLTKSLNALWKRKRTHSRTTSTVSHPA
ncbi:peptidoglycan/LPS O-acetylase OafA/YrhL [Ochrobactrum sp. RH1CCR137]|nr:peptidoglycan/LPS O-acetylase OafA/YrhL [Ochrobactrum sp. RH1CCR137]MBA8857398.1 peptidoglycan/LPS O-acetylase OafA/YrhL [Ochrobactrum sp. RH1CCR134]